MLADGLLFRATAVFSGVNEQVNTGKLWVRAEFSGRGWGGNPIIEGSPESYGGSNHLGKSGKFNRGAQPGSGGGRRVEGWVGTGLRLADWRISAAGVRTGVPDRGRSGGRGGNCTGSVSEGISRDETV